MWTPWKIPVTRNPSTIFAGVIALYFIIWEKFYPNRLRPVTKHFFVQYRSKLLNTALAKDCVVSGVCWKACSNFQLLISGIVSVRCGSICFSEYRKATHSVPKNISLVVLPFCVACVTEHGGSLSSHSDYTLCPEKDPPVGLLGHDTIVTFSTRSGASR